jgi:hypothetical protein
MRIEEGSARAAADTGCKAVSFQRSVDFKTGMQDSGSSVVVCRLQPCRVEIQAGKFPALRTLIFSD